MALIDTTCIEQFARQMLRKWNALTGMALIERDLDSKSTPNGAWAGLTERMKTLPVPWPYTAQGWQHPQPRGVLQHESLPSPERANHGTTQ